MAVDHFIRDIRFRGIRRCIKHLSFIAALSLAVAGMFLGSVSAMAAEQLALVGANFAVRDAMKHSNMPSLSGYGLKRITVVYESSLWPSGANMSQPNTTYIANTYIPKIKSSNPDVIIIDIEAWKLTTTSTSTEISAFITKFKKIIAVFRSKMPNTKIGVYLWVPERNWSAPCGDPAKRASRTAAWHNRNLKLQPLADAVDIIVPSLYTFYGDAASISCWPTYAKANIAEARIYKKPVWAFLWMKYHSDHNKFIPSSFWRKQLDTVYTYADGVVIWSMQNDDTWSWSAPWWLQTRDFLSDRNLD